MNLLGHRKDRNNKQRPVRQRSMPQRPLVESLESRQLLSAAANVVVHSDAIFRHLSTNSSSIQGYTPSQIRHAYGFDQVNFNNGAVTGNGSGQTIAIVDAYNDPNIKSDLNLFDSELGVSASASLTVVNENGGSQLPATDTGWAGEISLDVEWAHAIAPAANILLVEANSATLSDLLAGVNYARSAPGVSVVSMSWGGSEFFSFNGSEFTGQTQYDPTFTTPAGHQGVSFLAAAGDSGAISGVQWPASSPNVISVGGTSLYVQDQIGNYNNETSWNGTSGGFSQIEATPSYQQAVQNSGARSTPDVAFDADPNTGFAVYDSVPDQGVSGWEVVGGTSAGAPQWAALIAIANQGRALAGRGTLDGASQTLPVLYSLYSDPGTTGYSTYTSNFNDVVDSAGNNPWHWRWGGNGFANPAMPGYDTATGLGTPIAGHVVAALSGASGAAASGASGTSGTSGTQGANPAQLPASQLQGTMLTTPPASVIGGQKGSLKLRIDNTAATRFTGPVSISVYASTDNSLSGDDTFVQTLSVPRLNIRGNGSKTVTVKFEYPTSVADGSYYLIASINATSMDTAIAEADANAPVAIAAPQVDLATTFGAADAVLVKPGKDGVASINIQNLGNVTASGTVDLTLYASPSQTVDVNAQRLTAIPTHKINIRPGHSITLHVHFKAPAGQAGGSYNLIASTTSSTPVADSNPANDTAVIATRA